MNNRKRIFVDYSLRVICKFNLYRFIPAKILIRLRYFYNFGTDLNLRHPRTFCEKLQWLKLHDHRPEYTRMVDKYEAKQFITERIGEGFVIPTLGVWNKFEDIDFSLLPDQFVLKCNHDSGSVVLCRDKKTFDIEAARQKLESRLN